jgi:hypothetical protein
VIRAVELPAQEAEERSDCAIRVRILLELLVRARKDYSQMADERFHGPCRANLARKGGLEPTRDPDPISGRGPIRNRRVEHKRRLQGGGA